MTRLGEPRLNSPKRFVLAFAAAVLCLGLGAEASYRYWLFRTVGARPITQIATIDIEGFSKTYRQPGTVSGPYLPDSSFTMRMYGEDGTHKRTIRIRTNNLGWVSHNHQFEQKPPGEFRIAIVGDSNVASITNDFPWPDVVQRELTGDRALLEALGVNRIAVLNTGSAGAGYRVWQSILTPKARALSADFLLMNAASATGLLVVAKAGKFRGSELRIDEMKIALACTRDVPFFENCIPSPQWIVPPGEALPAARILDIKRRVAEITLTRRLLSYPLPLVLENGSETMRGPVLTSTVSQNDREDADIIHAIRREHPHSAVIYNPMQWEHTQQNGVERSREFLTAMAAAGVDITDMRTLLPKADDKEVLSWYNMPHDGHWSDKGAEIYGKAVAQLLKRQLLQLAKVLSQHMEPPIQISDERKTP